MQIYQELFLWFILFLYLHITRYTDLTTKVDTFKDYLNYQRGVAKTIVCTQILIFIGYCVLKYL